jgi:GGDEF domain-containing protein
MIRPDTRKKHKDVPKRDGKKSRVIELAEENADLRQQNASLKRELRIALKRVGELMVDGLTGVFNRAGLDDIIAKGLVAENAAIIYIDLDQFKPINDTYGHDAGDAVLKEVGVILTKNVKSDVDIIALQQKNQPVGQGPATAMKSVNTRIGGDEFVVILNDVNEKEANKILHRLEDEFEKATVKLNDGQAIKFGASFGMALWDTQSESFSSAKAKADKSMYERKQAKGNPPRNG